MKTTHTPGPWTWGYYGHNDDWVRTSNGDAVVQVGHNYSERQENGRLMAAAPDMLIALKSVEDYLASSPYATDSDAVLREVQAIIAKAEGIEK